MTCVHKKYTEIYKRLTFKTAIVLYKIFIYFKENNQVLFLLYEARSLLVLARIVFYNDIAYKKY